MCMHDLSRVSWGESVLILSCTACPNGRLGSRLSRLSPVRNNYYVIQNSFSGASQSLVITRSRLFDEVATYLLQR